MEFNFQTSQLQIVLASRLKNTTRVWVGKVAKMSTSQTTTAHAYKFFCGGFILEILSFMSNKPKLLSKQAAFLLTWFLYYISVWHTYQKHFYKMLH